jgi:peptide/nickel transport system substrate-binding protein
VYRILAQLTMEESKIKKALSAFSPLERMIFIGALVLSLVTALVIISKINAHFMVAVPASGGTLKEGVVGTPRYVNPLLAVTDADRDLSALTYRGLMKEDGKGNFIPDLAESYRVSENGLVYTFVLSEAYFHDGKRITAEDVVYTITSAQDPLLKSTKRIEWQGVSVRDENSKTVIFTLKAPYAPFLASTTIGIIPKHIWEKVPYENWIYSDFNTKNVIGSGWYRVTKVSENSSGVPHYYELKLYKKSQSIAVRPFIKKVTVRFYANESALLRGFERKEVDTVGGISSRSAGYLASKKDAVIISSALPRIFGIFFNQKQAPLFASTQVRKAIDSAIDRERIINEVLNGYGSIATSPIPASTGLTSTNTTRPSVNTENARLILQKDGWRLGDDGIFQKTSGATVTRLSFEIATNDVPELKDAVNRIVEDLKIAGIEAIPKVYETGSLNQDIIRPRKFQALFFGQVVSSQSDLFAFWHSSQRVDPGLNISSYANPAVDKILEQGLQTLDPVKRTGIYEKLVSTIEADMPALFVYSPSYLYAVRSTIPGITLEHINRPEDRFANQNTWYLHTDNVWKLFIRD